MPASKEEININIETLQANLTVIKQCRESLSSNEQNDILYPMIIQLRDLCDICIPAFKPSKMN